jgi:hypothetical protein
MILIFNLHERATFMRMVIKVLLLTLFPFFSACTTTQEKQNDLSFAAAKSIEVGKTSKGAIIKQFGLPTDQTGSESQITYCDPKTSSQRLTIKFNKGSNLVESVLWIPLGENEVNLDSIRNLYPSGGFELLRSQSNQDFTPSEITYFNELNGVTILTKDEANQVTAVSWHGPQSRAATSSKQ